MYVFASLEHSKRILCLAYHMGLIYPTYQWVILSQSISDFNYEAENSSEHPFTFVHNEGEYTCSSETLLLALEKSFLIDFHVSTRKTEEELYLNVSFGDLELYWKNSTAMPKYWAYNLVDAVWAWANVLHKMTIDNREVEFGYGNASLADMIVKQFFNLTFEGISGQIGFNSSSGFANRQTNLYQISKGKPTVIGVNNSTTNIILQPFSHISDHVKNINLVPKGVVGFFMAVQCVELLTLVLLHAITFVYRGTKTVKATSPKLTHLAFIGQYVFLTSLMLYCISWLSDYGSGIDAVLCQTIWAWGLPLGFTLCFGVVTVRSWRLYRIFIHYQHPGRFISDPALTVAVLMLASVDVVVAVIWTSVEPIQIGYVEINMENGSEYEVVSQLRCYYGTTWPIMILLYKITLLFVLVVITVLTRQIPNPTFSNKSIHIYTYTFSILFVLGFTLYYTFLFVLPNIIVEFIILVCLLNTMLVLFLMFVVAPPLVPLFRKIKQQRTVTKFR